MRQYLLLSGVIALMMTATDASANKSDRPDLPESIQQLRAAAEQARLINKQNATGPVWRPAKVQEFWWGGTDWQSANENAYTYFEDGKVKTASTPYGRTDYEYDDKGRLVKELQYETVDGDRLQSTTVFTYDTVVEHLIVKTEFFSEWGNDVSGIEITRNEDGNITLVRHFRSNGAGSGSFEFDGNRLVIAYGADGKAATITEEYVDGDEVEVETKLTNIVWENTDGQIYEVDVELEDAAGDDDGIFFGANRIKSADVVAGLPGDAKLTCTYNPDNIGFTGELKLNNEVVSSMVFAPVDDFGSYDCESFAVDFDYDEDTGTWERDGAAREKTTYRVDKFGLVLLD